MNEVEYVFHFLLFLGNNNAKGINDYDAIKIFLPLKKSAESRKN